MNILEELKNRRILKDVTNEEKFSQLKKGDGVYIGFDPTAESLHLGNFIQIATLLRFKEAGFSPVAVLGGATGMIGDPSGKSEERNLLDEKALKNNKDKIRKQLEFYGLKVIDNYDFYKDMNVLTFFREVGKLINVNYMTAKEVVASRLENGISFTEFSYQLIQGWDFKELYEKHNVSIEVGGSDQWGNITTGIEIIRKTNGDDNTAVGITTNLLTTSNGKKFGKSEGNAIWIDRLMTTPYALYQYLLNTPDDDLETIFNWVTLVPSSVINSILREHSIDPSKRIGQKKLASEIVKLIHSEKDAESAKQMTDVLWGQADIKILSTNDIASLEGSIPTSKVQSENIIEVLKEIGAASSNREAREFINAGAVVVNGETVTSENYIIQPFLFDKKYTLLKRGKKKYYLIKH